MSDRTKHAASLRDYLHVLRRRRWLVAQAVVLVPAAAVALSLRQQPLYQSCSQVLLSRQNLATSLTGTQDPNQYIQADRLAQTQADVARVPAIAAAMLERLRIKNLTVTRFLRSSSVSAAQNADLLKFCVTNANSSLARRLADGYAREFTVYRRKLDTAALQRAHAGVEARLAQLEHAHQTRSDLYASLADREQQLATMEALQTSNAFVVQGASPSERVQPRPVRNGILGGLLGVILGIALAFLWEALDTRVRTADEIADRLGLTLLARLPEPPRRLRSKDSLTMLADPSSNAAEAYRMLRTNLEFALLDRDVKSLLVTSSVEQEGKSTTIANLAVALARAGKRVVLVDLDLRRPYLHKFFGIDGPGFTEVALGRVDLREALASVAVGTLPPARRLFGRSSDTNGHGNGNGNGNGNGSSPYVFGRLEVLTAGPIPPDPGEFVGRRVVREILDDLSEDVDLVLVDAPPMLHVGDAMTLSTNVDAMLVVTRMNVVRRNMLVELARALARTPVPKVGFVTTAAQEEEGYGYGYDYGYGSVYAPLPDAVQLGAER